MPLFKLRIPAADLAAGRAAADALGELSAPQPLAVSLFEDRPPTYVVEAYFDAEPAHDAIATALAAIGSGLSTPSIEALPEQNWVAVSQASLAPIAAGRFVVHGSHDRYRFALSRHAIEIEAGEAFGTGYNATTALCLEAIDRLARRRRFDRVLDLGCGSGLLAIAAARALPAARILAADNDPIATAIARTNVRVNRVARRVHVIDAAGFNHPLLRAQPFDLVLANILARTLIDLAPDMRRAVRPGGVAVLSGLLDPQAREVSATYRAAGFRLVEDRRRDGWVALALARLDRALPTPGRRA
jgi:ribosomal protein L11 methyltransferase